MSQPTPSPADIASTLGRLAHRLTRDGSISDAERAHLLQGQLIFNFMTRNQAGLRKMIRHLKLYGSGAKLSDALMTIAEGKPVLAVTPAQHVEWARAIARDALRIASVEPAAALAADADVMSTATDLCADPAGTALLGPTPVPASEHPEQP